jgi:hypothetical protein
MSLSSDTIPDSAVQAVVIARYGYYSAATWQPRDAIRRDLAAAIPHLLTDEMVERAWGAYSDPGDYATDQEEMDAMRHALEAALEASE